MSRYRKNLHLPPSSFANWWLLPLILLALTWASYPFAQTSPTQVQTNYMDQTALDQLFVQLAQAPNKAKADEISSQIWRLWFSPNQENLTTRMQAFGLAQQNGNDETALRIVDSIVRDFPAYAEGWNQRATLFFLSGDMEASLADIEQVLTREPRHFGALSGQALIYKQIGREELALDAILRALQIHPFLSQRAIFEEILPPPTNT